MVGSEVSQQAYVQGPTHMVYREWSVGQLLAHAVAHCPERVALIVPPGADGRPERQWSYRALEADARRAACALLAHFNPGDRVATWAAGSADFIVLQLGAALAGVVLVLLNPANRSSELKSMLAHSRARGLFLDRGYRKMDNVAVLEEVRPALDQLRTVVYMDQWQAFLDASAPTPLPQVAPDSAALILFTSGSTGAPKAAVLHHGGIVNSADLTARHLGFGISRVWLNVLPMFHVGGNVTMTLGVIANLGTHVMLPEFNADTMLDAMQRYQVNFTMAVPTMMNCILESTRLAATDLSALEMIVVGGSPVAPELVRRIKQAIGAEVATLMGQTEAGGVMFATCSGDSEDCVTASVGRPLGLTEAKIVSTTDGAGTAAVGEIGEICVRARSIMRGYFEMPDKTAEMIDADGWLHTGDLGYMRPDGYFQITGRLKDMIIRGGENIYAREVEDVLIEHPDVAQAVVFGVPDDKWGEQVVAAVIARAGHTPDTAALTAFLQTRIARHKVPKFWRVVDSFPLNPTGKVQKFLLREQFMREAS